MSHIAAVTPYVRLYTYSQYESHQTVPDWALTAFFVVMLLRLRGDWRQEIYDYISRNKDGEKLMGYLQVNPATYGVDWILAIINHINDHNLDKAGILSDDYAMRMIVTAHSENRYDHPSEWAEDGMHARYFDVGNVSTVRIAHDKGGTISGLEVTAGRETDPAALETVFRILDSMAGLEATATGDTPTGR